MLIYSQNTKKKKKWAALVSLKTKVQTSRQNKICLFLTACCQTVNKHVCIIWKAYELITHISITSRPYVTTVRQNKSVPRSQIYIVLGKTSITCPILSIKFAVSFKGRKLLHKSMFSLRWMTKYAAVWGISWAPWDTHWF